MKKLIIIIILILLLLLGAYYFLGETPKGSDKLKETPKDSVTTSQTSEKKEIADKDIPLESNQILVKVTGISEDRFSGTVLVGNDDIPANELIVFLNDNKEELAKLSEEGRVVLNIPTPPVMTRSMPPQMPRTEIVATY